MAINKQHTNSLIHLGFILLNAKEYNRAHKYFRFALKVDPSLASCHYGEGRVFQTMKNYTKASEHFYKCLEIEQNNFKAMFQIGVIYLDKSNYIKAKEMFIKCLEVNPDYVLGLIGLGDVHFELGEYDKAEEYHEKGYLLSDKQDLHMIISYANTLSAVLKYDQSIALLIQALNIDPELSDVHYFLANNYYLTEKYNEAISHYVSTIKTSKGKDVNPQAYYNLGNALCSRYRHREAVKCYNYAIKLDYTNTEAFFNLGNVYFLCGMFSKATQKYEECLSRNFNVKEVKFALCRNLFAVATEEAYVECEELIESLLKEDKDNVKLHMFCATIKQKLNKMEEAQSAYAKVVQIEPQNMEAKFNLNNYQYTEESV